MKKRTKALLWVIIIIVIIAGGYYIIQQRNAKAVEEANKLPDIAMKYTVKRTSIGDYLEVMGTVNAPERSVFGRINGEIEKIFVDVNDSISEGDTVTIVDSTQYELNYLQAKTAYDNSIGQAAKTVEERELSLKIAKQNLDNTIIKSPVSGFVKQASFNEGDLISSNSVVSLIVQDDEMYVEASVDEVDLTKIKIGQKVQFVFEPLGNLTLNGKIREISQHADTSGGIVVIPVEFSFDKSPKGTGVIPGLTCSANIILMENTDIITIPVLAVQKDKQGSFVYVDSDKKMKNDDSGKTSSESEPGEKRYIKIGQSTEQYVEVVSGLEEGEVVIIQPDKTRALEVMKQLNPSFTGGGKPTMGKPATTKSYPGK